MRNRIKKQISKEAIFNGIACALLLLAHVALLLAVFLSWRYYSIYPSLFGSIVAIIICLMIVIDIIFFVGFNHRDLALKIISTVLAFMLFVGGTAGSYFINRANGIVNNVLDDGKSDKYETFSGVFVCYDKNNSFKQLSDLSGKRVGMLLETSDGITSIATDLLSKENIDYATVDYKTNAEMMQGLLDGDVDAIAITSAYRTIYGNDENSTFKDYLDHLIDFSAFEQELKIESNKTKKNLSKDPFNVLLIGYSRTDIGSTIGLADSIILTTINPQTYTVSMMSIARDSFVPISCYGGAYDKINSGRATSRACFIETVEEFIGQDIDYYMELDYLGLVQIVNAIGGIYINNPVAFELDGIYVPAGEQVFADGQMALQFCRERHHMPNGDFDRQQHQKEVIMAIAKKFIQSGDITLALNAMDAASRWMSTDLTLSQLTSVFNLLLNTRNYTGMDTFDLVDFHTLRITGYGGIMYYSYSMHLPLWVYLIYQGSYDESIGHMKEVLGQYGTISQDYNFEFSSRSPYARPAFYSTDYEHKFMYEPDPMPPYWANLTGMTYADAMAWASENGVTLTPNFITADSPKYDASLDGQIIEQSVRYGALISEYKSGTITIMGTGELDEDTQVPNFVGKNYSKAVKWAKNHYVPYKIVWDNNAATDPGKVVSQSHSAYTPINNVDLFTITVRDGSYKVRFNNNGVGTYTPELLTVKLSDDEPYDFTSSPYLLSDVEAGSSDLGELYEFLGWYTKASGGEQVYDSSAITEDITLYAHWELTCSHSNATSEITQQPTCGETGIRTYTCPRCQKTWTEVVSATGDHTWGDWITDTEAQVGIDGSKHHECSICGAREDATIPALPEPGGEGGEGN